MRKFATKIRPVAALLLALVLTVTSLQLSIGSARAAEDETVYLKIKYVKEDGEDYGDLTDEGYNGQDIWVKNQYEDDEGHVEYFTEKDSEGIYTIIETTRPEDPEKNIEFFIRKTAGDSDSKFGNDQFTTEFAGSDAIFAYFVARTDADGNDTYDDSDQRKAVDDATVRLHYFREDGKYGDWDVWGWSDGKEGAGYAFGAGTDDFGAYTDINVGALDAGQQIGFIVRKPDWSAKDYDRDRFVDPFFLDADGNGEVYVLSGQEQGKVYYSKKDAMAAKADMLKPRITAATIDSMTEINFTTNKTLESDNANVKLTDGEGNEVALAKVELSEDGKSGTVTAADNLDLGKQYTLEITGRAPKTVSFGKVYNSKAFEDLYTYEGNLGAVYSAASTEFILWAPSAANVQLALYGKDGKNYKGAEESTVQMKRGEKGTWKTTVFGDLDGTFYNYLVSVDGETNEVVDPYAKAVGVNGDRGMVVDLSKTNPAGWDADVKPIMVDATDAIIYEMHIRDFTISANSGAALEYKGKFNGVWQSGTTIPGDDVATGVDHLKELGVNVVHLLPSFDYASVDETQLDKAQFNWGYDPKNYNVPDGSYSSDPYTGKIRIEEFKKMVMELHKAGIRVVMDVVYNHTAASADSHLNKAVPNYYYRQNAQGGFSNGSGCGNETASDRSMCGRMIIDSVLYWAEEYHIDGFRFDLMAVHDVDTLMTIREGLNRIDSTILMYGEGWTGGDCALDSKLQATKANTLKFGELQIAAFSDDIRDGIKGHVFTATGKAFVNGGEGYEETIKFGIVASTINDQINYSKVMNQTRPWANEPYQTISYASAHDNLTLWDKLNTSNAGSSEEELLAMNKLSAAIVYTSQGIPFMQAGEEMARTKTNADGSFNENSYNSPDSVNQIDWSRKVTYNNLYEYYRGLIGMRKLHKAFHMNTTADIQKSIKFLDAPAKMVAYTLDGTAAKDSWKNIVVAFNADTKAASLTIPEGKWVVVVNGDKAGVKELARIDGGTIQIPAQSSYVLVDANSFDGKSPNTGDEIPVLPVAMLLISMLGIAVLGRKAIAR